MSNASAVVPLPEIRATIILIHPSLPVACPDCGRALEPTEVAEGAPAGLTAYRCAARHRIHVGGEQQ